MRVLDKQSIRREVGNRRLGRRRLEARLRQETDRRRPGRGARAQGRDPETVRRRRTRVDRGSRVANLLAGFGRGLMVAALLPLQLGFLLLRPKELAARVRALPARMESGTRRLRMASRDPETRAGRVWDTAVLSAHFLREEVADMQDGFPSREELLADLTGGASVLRGGVERMLARAGGADGDSVGDRLLHAAGLGVIVGVVVVGLFMAGHGALEAVSDSDRMLVQDIHIRGAARTPEHVVREQLGLAPGDHLLRLDLEAAAADVETLPWVAEALVTKDIRERTLSVEVVERRPALVLIRDGLRLVDDTGTPFKQVRAGDPADFPVLTGLDDVDLESEAGRGLLAGALEVLHSLSASGEVGRPAVSEIRWAGDDGWSLVTRDGLPVRLGRQDFGARLGRLERAVARAGLPLSAIDSVDVGLRDRLVVVPKRTKKAKRKVVAVVTEQPVQAVDRARLVHLERIRRSMGRTTEVVQ